MVKTRIEMLRVVWWRKKFIQQESVMVMKHLNIVTRDMNINAIHFQHTAVSGASENSDEEE